MQLQIRGQETHIINCDEDRETIAQIKAGLGVEDATNLTLHCAGVPLSDELCVSELSTNVLELTVPLKGGKVHGSLARAGKVRSQTPKVEKQEKRKKKTGGAQRYTHQKRRFVTVDQTFGGRRGPNANPNT